MLFSLTTEASVPLTKNNKSRPHPELFTIDPEASRLYDWNRRHDPNAKDVSAESSFSGILTNQQAAYFFELINDERYTNDYLKSLVFVTDSTKWVTYVNKRLNYYIEYPDIFTKEIEAPNESDGLWIESSNGIIKLATLDSYNPEWKNAKSRLVSLLYQLKGKVIIMKKENGNNWYRFVYRDVYYTVHRYGIVDNGMEICFILTYPNVQSDTFDVVVKRMEQTLKVEE